MEKKVILGLFLLSSFILFTSSRNLEVLKEELDLLSKAAIDKSNEAQVGGEEGSIRERILKVGLDDYTPTGPNPRHTPTPPHPYAP
ncbi:hypothetical protein Ancab_033203 [Ancistrocladus abbreviatus]